MVSHTVTKAITVPRDSRALMAFPTRIRSGIASKQLGSYVFIPRP